MLVAERASRNQPSLSERASIAVSGLCSDAWSRGGSHTVDCIDAGNRRIGRASLHVTGSCSRKKLKASTHARVYPNRWCRPARRPRNVRFASHSSASEFRMAHRMDSSRPNRSRFTRISCVSAHGKSGDRHWSEKTRITIDPLVLPGIWLLARIPH